MVSAGIASVLQRVLVVPASTLGERLDVPGGRPPFPVAEPLAPLLPGGGLRRGSVVAVHGSMALLLALLSAATAQGAWAAVVGVGDLGLLAAAEAGVVVQRLALVPRPGSDPAPVAAALLDGVGLVALAGADRMSPGARRSLAARARQRGSVLLPLGQSLGQWPGAEIELDCRVQAWHGRQGRIWAAAQPRSRGARSRPRCGGSASHRSFAAAWSRRPGGGGARGPDSVNQGGGMHEGGRVDQGGRLMAPARVVVVWCPELAVLTDDPDRDARVFEPVVAAVETLAPGVEVVCPGLVAVPARGPTRYFGGESTVVKRIVDVVAEQAGVTCQVGIADGLFAATLAAHRGLLVPPEGSADFLAPLGIAELHQPAVTGVDRAAVGRAGVGRAALVDLLHRLGLRTLGAFAALPVNDVASRFGLDGVRAHRLARGLDDRPLARRDPPVDLTVTRRFDPPLERVDAAAFASREPAEQLHTTLAARGLACVRLGISAGTEAGEQLHRVWRCAQPLAASGIADRVRWQLDGWLTSRRSRPSAGITLLWLIPEEVIGGQALQRGLWGEPGKDDERAGRALLRVQGMLGPEAVLIGVLGGGRSPTDRARLVPWGDDLTPAHLGQPPWPGRLPAPSPSRVPTRPLPAEVLDDAGRVVGVSGRGMLTSVPYRIAVDGHPPCRVLAWAGPWPVEERWWEPGGGQRCARLQAVLGAQPTEEPFAVLLSCAAGRWWVEGIYE